ncbi:MAG: hypothetical protein Q4A05_01375 [Ruminococcus sp.]|nr:hypothetical protein [Ruminococcus sp.]
MKKAAELLTAAALTAAAAMCIFAADTVGASVYAALQRCLTAVIPSLFAMIAASALLIRSGTVSAAGRLVHRAGRLLLGMDGDIFVIFLFSNIAGYPVGARMLLSCCESGRLTRREAELLAGVCFGAGPAFIYGCIAGQLYRSARVGLLISLSSFAGSLAAAAVLSAYLRRHGHGAPPRTGISFRAEMLPDCVSAAGRSMAEICAAILGFAVISAILARVGVLPAAAGLLSRLTGRDFTASAGLICSALDVTAVGSLPAGDFTLLPEIAALVTFGGGCVFMQLAAIFRGRLSLLPAAAIRLGAAAVSFGVCRLMLPLFIAGETVSAAVTAQTHRAPSPVPSVLLAVMTAMVFAQYEKCRRKNV